MKKKQSELYFVEVTNQSLVRALDVEDAAKKFAENLLNAIQTNSLYLSIHPVKAISVVTPNANVLFGK